MAGGAGLQAWVAWSDMFYHLLPTGFHCRGLRAGCRVALSSHMPGACGHRLGTWGQLPRTPSGGRLAHLASHLRGYCRPRAAWAPRLNR